MKKATIDFETRSLLDVTQVGAFKYAEDPSTRILFCSYSIDGVKYQRYDWREFSEPTALLEHVRNGGRVEAHNMFFEFCIWNLVAVPQLGWPLLKLEQCECSAAKARGYCIPGSLDGASRFLGLAEKKDSRGKQLIKLLSVPQKVTKNNLNLWNNDDSLHDEFGDYCDQDVATEECISENTPPLIPVERKVWLMDQRINWRGVPIDIELAKAAVYLIEQIEKLFCGELAQLTNGEITSGKQHARFKKFLLDRGVEVDSVDKKAVVQLLKRKDLSAECYRLVELRQLLGMSSGSKYAAMLLRAAEDERVHEVILYCKAHTGRWAGLGIQIQNFPRPTVKVKLTEEQKEGLSYAEQDELKIQLLVDAVLSRNIERLLEIDSSPLAVVTSALRHCIRAPEGKTFICSDYSAIEARVVLWLAGDEEACEVYRKQDRGEISYGMYEVMAGRIFGKHPTQVTSEERFVGKQAILGLGYGMGVKTFMMTCENFDFPISEALAQRSVNTYRSTHKKIAGKGGLWQKLEKAAKSAIGNRGETFHAGGVNYVFSGKKDVMICTLPSGRRIFYHNPHLKEGSIRFSMQRDGGVFPEKTWGGTLAENVTQAIARDLMANGMMNAEEAGFPIIASIHDEAITEVAEDGAEDRLPAFDKALCELPTWAEGVPLNAEGWVGTRYRK